MENLPVVIRRDVPRKTKYSDYQDDLRIDFIYSCAYCTITEIEATAIGFEIDHYLPQTLRPDLVNVYANLMWACKKCNSLKRAFNQGDYDETAGDYILRPDRENPNNHYLLEGNRLSGKTHTGEFNIICMGLNRKHLQKLRELRSRYFDSDEIIANGIRLISKIRIDRLKKERRFLFLKMRKAINERKDSIDEMSTVSFLKDFAKSDLIDADPDNSQQLKIRKKYLDGQKAIYPH